MARVWSLQEQEQALDWTTFSRADGRAPSESRLGGAGGERPSGAVEVRVFWGGDLLEVRHLEPGRSYRVGEHDVLPLDFIAPAEKLGGASFTLLDYDAGGCKVHVPPAATLTGSAGTAVDGRVELAPGTDARVTFGDLGFEFVAVSPGERTPRALFGASDRSGPVYFGLAALTFGALALGLSLAVPPFELLDDESLQRERVATIIQILTSDAERERPPSETENTPEQGPAGGETAAAARGESGKMGKVNVAPADRKIAFRGDSDKVTLSRDAALAEARSIGMIGLLSTMNAGHPLHVPWGAAPEGMDGLDAMGNLWGRELGESGGSGGLNLSSTGEGGGGDATDSIGLRMIGTCSTGVCSGLDQGFGRSPARGQTGHVTRAPRLRQGESVVSGRLAPEVVQRIVRQNFGRFRMCYEQGLQRNPNLEGRVAVRFVIGRDGAVSTAQNGGSDIPDSGVVACVVRAYYGLSFPSPENGIVTVQYPIMFAPG